MKTKKNVRTQTDKEKIRKVTPKPQRTEGKEIDRTISLYEPLPHSTSPRPTMARPLNGSLPLDFRASKEDGKLVPAILFAPPHLRKKEQFTAMSPSTEVMTEAIKRTASHVSALVSSDTSALTSGEAPTTDDKFLEQTEAMLQDSGSDGLQSRFKASATDPSYDFDEYIFLRNPDDPYARDLPDPTGTPQAIPSDPRFSHFVSAAENGITSFVEHARLQIWPPPQDIVSRAAGLQQTILSWWSYVCSIRAFNRLGRYSKSEIKEAWSLSPEAFYGQSLSGWLSTTAVAEAQAYLTSGDGMDLGKLLTVVYWEGVLSSLFEEYFPDYWLVDPTAPEGEYPFEPFSADEVLFGLQVVHRQTWHLLGYARGELVKSIPLGPKESQKVNVKVTRRTKTARTSEETTSFETTSETSTTTKDTSEVVAEASEKLNRHAEAEVSGGYGPFVQAKVSGGVSEDLGSSSKDTKTRLNEQMQKTASRMKRDTKVTVNTESEESFELNRASELINPNDEIAVTYLYHRLQQRYWVSTEIAEVHSVVFVPEPLPEWDDINEGWIREHGEFIAGALLDSSFAPILAAIRKEPANLTYAPTNVFSNAAQAGIDAANNYKSFTGGYMPDLLASGSQSFERDYERRNNLAMDQARRTYQSEALLTHIRRNILHYMRAIWASEDYDQRMQRFSRMRVPTTWIFVPRTPVPGVTSDLPLQVEGVFMPDSTNARPLTEVLDPIGPIGFLFNCAIYRLRNDPKLINLHQALAYLRAAYARFAVTVTASEGAGVTLGQAVASSPRSFLAEYTLTYRTNRGKWLIPRPGLPESDWFEVNILPDGSLDFLGLRLWLDGNPADQATLTINIRMTGELEDPHFRLVQMLHPLPASDVEEQVFTDDLLREMVTVLPELAAFGDQSLNWTTLPELQKTKFREHYHQFLMLLESGRLVTLDTANVVLDLEISRSPALEQFKRLHRYIDVLKEYQELRRRSLDNTRREELMKKGVLGDPDIDRITLVGARDDIKDVVALPNGLED